ncbi:hypothetical protein [Pseudonocardia sp. TRM90224]|uniref:hypothetical protein n=1 Tax=Pseudonocardia sp. TRM90224 TaxID=2812678 RepID=UPI001E38456C|nr:hypothetical protein [Pseudonocardia sp. TRM90224]
MTAVEGRLSFAGVVRSELTKVFSQRSWWLVLCVAPLLMIGLAGSIGWNGAGRAEPLGPSAVVGGGFPLFALLIGVFGLLMMASEHASGSIRATMTAVPRRLPVLWAKAVVVVGVTLPVLAVAYVGCYVAHQVLAGEPVAIFEPEVVGSIAGVVGATAATGLIGLAVGTMLRNMAVAIVGYVVGLLVLPPVLLSILPAALQDTVVPYLPQLALQAMYTLGGAAGPMLPPGAGAVVMLAWVAVALAGAAAVVHRREV